MQMIPFLVWPMVILQQAQKYELASSDFVNNLDVQFKNDLLS